MLPPAQAIRAACIVYATADFALRVGNATAEPDVQRGVPLDMQQYSKMFKSTRLPRKPSDIRVRADGLVRHILVMRGQARLVTKRRTVL